MPELSYAEITDDTLQATAPPRSSYYAVVALLGLGIIWAVFCFTYQVLTGMGVTGLNHPVGWAIYIANFVFWVGIAHSGTLISAILFLMRAKWRNAVSRSSEAMTIFAVMTAGLFPMIHLGRVWVFYYILPYPSQRQIWPNFVSPLIWDVLAVGTYFTVSLIFFYVGLIPDLASARDRAEAEQGYYSTRARIYRGLALGWSGAGSQWRHYGRSYLFFAALATPLVVSVHSVVSWDFAMSLLPGWHTTIFAPYFVAGAIHSGLAMVLTLLIPMRSLLNLKRIITIEHFEMVAKTMLVTTLIVGYAYVIEPFTSWYSGDIFEQQFSYWRAMTGEPSLIFWSLVPLNVLFPLLFCFKKVRRNLVLLFAISILVNVGMWLERVMIVYASTAHDFLPHNWGPYHPTWVEISITVGSFTWFFFWFFLFAKTLPTIPMTDLKEQTAQKEEGPPREEKRARMERPGEKGITAVYTDAKSFTDAMRRVTEGGLTKFETFSPTRVEGVARMLGEQKSPVRIWTLVGGLSGLVGGFGLAIYAATLNGLIVGGKPPVAWIPYCVPGFEGTILLGSIGNLIGLLIHARLGSPRPLHGYLGRFSRDRFGIFVADEGLMGRDKARQLLAEGAEEIYAVE